MAGLGKLKNLSPTLFNDRINKPLVKEPIENQHDLSVRHEGVGEYENPQHNGFVFNYPISYLPEQGGLHKRQYSDEIKKMEDRYGVVTTPFGFSPAVDFFSGAFGDPNDPATPFTFQPFYHPPGFTINFTDPHKSKLAPEADFALTTLHKIDSFEINLQNYPVIYKDLNSPLMNTPTDNDGLMGSPDIDLDPYGSSPIEIPDTYSPFTMDGETMDYNNIDYGFNSYKGSVFDNGIGGLFNSSTRYSNSFRVINSPTLDDIVEKGNMSPKLGSDPGSGFKEGSYPISPSELVQKMRVAEDMGRPEGYLDFGGDNISLVSQWPVHGQNTSYLPILSNYVEGSTDGTGAPVFSNITGKRKIPIHLEDVTGSTIKTMNQFDILYTKDQKAKEAKKLMMPGQSLSLQNAAYQTGYRGDEPYIIYDKDSSDIWHKIGREMPIMHAKNDLIRVSKFLSSHAGISFILKQQMLGGLHRWNPLSQQYVAKVIAGGMAIIPLPGGGAWSWPLAQKYRPFYNPLSTLANISLHGLAGYGMPNTYTFGRDWPFMWDGAGKSGYSMNGGGFWGTDHGDGNYTQWLNDTEYKQFEDEYMYRGQFTGRKANIAAGVTANTNVQKSMDPQPRGPAKGFGDFMTLSELTSHGHIGSYDGEEGAAADNVYVNDSMEAQQHGMPFYFKDMRDNSLIIFRANITGLVDTITPDWNEEVYVGRSEPVYMYKSATREITMRLSLAAQTRFELNSIYKKINKLTSLAYPQYIADTSFLASKLRARPPLCKLRIGELFGSADVSADTEKVPDGSGGEKDKTDVYLKGKELGGIIMSLAYEFPDNAPWEVARGKRVPKFIHVDISFRVIHDVAPDMQTKFYGFTGHHVGDNNPFEGSGMYYNEEGEEVNPMIWGW